MNGFDDAMIVLGTAMAVLFAALIYVLIRDFVETRPSPPVEQRHVVMVKRPSRPYDWDRDGI